MSYHALPLACIVPSFRLTPNLPMPDACDHKCKQPISNPRHIEAHQQSKLELWVNSHRLYKLLLTFSRQRHIMGLADLNNRFLSKRIAGSVTVTVFKVAPVRRTPSTSHPSAVGLHLATCPG